MVIVLSVLAIACAQKLTETKSEARERWSVEQANAWYSTKPWLHGADFIPSTAINQLEMWQAETFDTITINRELGLAESIGMNSMRVYYIMLHGRQISKALSRAWINI